MENKRFYECPKCKSDNIGQYPMDVSEKVAWRIVRCRNCNFEWYEIFEFVCNESMENEVLDKNGNPI